MTHLNPSTFFYRRERSGFRGWMACAEAHNAEARPRIEIPSFQDQYFSIITVNTISVCWARSFPIQKSLVYVTSGGSGWGLLVSRQVAARPLYCSTCHSRDWSWQGREGPGYQGLGKQTWPNLKPLSVLGGGLGKILALNDDDRRREERAGK